MALKSHGFRVVIKSTQGRQDSLLTTLASSWSASMVFNHLDSGSKYATWVFSCSTRNRKHPTMLQFCLFHDH